MSADTTFRLVILMEPELRKASALLDRVVELQNRAPQPDENDEEYARAAIDALNACIVALHGASDAEAVLMLSAAEIGRTNPRRIKVSS